MHYGILNTFLVISAYLFILQVTFGGREIEHF